MPIPFARPSQAVPAGRQMLDLYRQRAPRYDMELAPFEPIRRQAIERLGLKPGQTVLDVGCGTGLSLPGLCQAVGSQGRVIGVEQCPEMLAHAHARMAETSLGAGAVELVCSPVQQASLDGWADAAMFHFTHDIVCDPHALARVLAHLKPGARIVATGLQWAPAWAWLANAWVWSAALYSVSSLRELEAPWRLLAAVLPGLQVEPIWQGAVYLAHGHVPDAR